MVGAVVLLAIGTVVLVAGAEWAIQGAARVATARGLSPFVLGALLFGIDLEGLGAAVIAAHRGETSIAAGEAFGTIVFLASVAFGAALLVARRPVEAPQPGMIVLPGAAVVAASYAAFDSVVTRAEGVLLVAGYAGYVALVVREGRLADVAARRIEREAREGGQRTPALLLLIGGLALVYLGASLLVGGGAGIVSRTGLSAGFVGAAIVGALASADEVLLEVVPIRRGMPELATGNLFGTIAAFCTAVIGLAALVRPLALDSAARTALVAAAALYAFVSVVFLVRGRAGKVTGALLLGGYGAFLAYTSGV